MTYPASDVNTTNLDAGTDSRAAARVDLLDLVTKFNLLRNHISAWFQTFLTSTSADTALTNLGGTTVGKSVFTSANDSAARTAIVAARSGANTDITSLSSPAIGSATATTQSDSTNNTTVATTAFVNSTVRSSTRQTVLSGPVLSINGNSNFGGSTGSTTVTASGTLIVSASFGTKDRVGSITNPSWTGLSSASSTYHLYIDVAADGTCTTGSVVGTNGPVYTQGTNYSVSLNDHTFSIPEMTMKVGTGASSTQVWRVFVGTALTGGFSTVTQITWWAIRGQWRGSITALSLSSQTVLTHNIGIPFAFITPQLYITPDGSGTQNGWNGYTNSDPDFLLIGSGTQISYSCSNSTQLKISTANSISVVPGAGGAPVSITPSNWRLYALAYRNF
jgi:hypothetical protein